MGIKPIETVYNGYRFRSRLEARWAVFFDHMGIEYQYEAQGYDLGEAGWYLPDFYLPEFRYETWFEVKGREPSVKEIKRARSLALKSRGRVYIFHGECWMPEPDEPKGLCCYEDGVIKQIFMATCMACDRFQFQLRPFDSCSCGGSASYDFDPLPRAYLAARQARFEHGESGFRA